MQPYKTLYIRIKHIEPIKWWVLHIDGKKALLIADKILDVEEFDNAGLHSTTYQGATIYNYIKRLKKVQALRFIKRFPLIKKTALLHLKKASTKRVLIR